MRRGPTPSLSFRTVLMCDTHTFICLPKTSIFGNTKYDVRIALPADTANFQNCHTFHTFHDFHTFYTCYKIVTLFILFRLFTLFTLVTTGICWLLHDEHVSAPRGGRAAAARRPRAVEWTMLSVQCHNLNYSCHNCDAANPRPNKSFRTWAVNLGSS